MIPHQTIIILCGSSQQLPHPSLGPLKGFLSWSRALDWPLQLLLVTTETQGHGWVWCRSRPGGPWTPPRTIDANLDCAFVKKRNYCLSFQILEWPGSPPWYQFNCVRDDQAWFQAAAQPSSVCLLHGYHATSTSWPPTRSGAEFRSIVYTPTSGQGNDWDYYWFKWASGLWPTLPGTQGAIFDHFASWFLSFSLGENFYHSFCLYWFILIC